MLIRFLLWQDRNGNLANGAIANLVDEVGGAVVYVEGLPMKVSVDMSISFVSTAKVNVSVQSLDNPDSVQNELLLQWMSIV